MLEVWNTLVLVPFDLLLGRLRAMSPDAVLIVVAVGSAFVLTLVRKWTTDQDLLRRVADDRRRLRQLRRQAKRRGDRPAGVRHRALLGRVGIKALCSEGRPLLVSIVPIAALATWCFLRLEFHAPQEQDGVELSAYTSVSLVGSVVHVVPEAGISTASWTAEVEADTEAEVARGIARWTLHGRGRPDPYRLTIRLGEVTCERDVSFAPGPYAAPTAEHDDGRVVTELGLRPVNLWGLAPGLPALQLPPWLVAYVVLVIPVVWISRRMLRVA